MAQALQFLRQEPPFERALRHDIVVLDLNLPLKNGQEVGVKMASDPAINAIPVATLTTSTSETCVCDIYPAGRCHTTVYRALERWDMPLKERRCERRSKTGTV